ncbi:unnamed protein product [Lepeophtheirus salmonis]|uniref:(salmon louse) hypothetical protein n=1 Tax=Lepeophtheirus salmonis TaxID=72036 RepID=A0A7R8D0J2_LEPSM|nr:unnamed protein product [Lepeophtheirus salmonis]CAF2959573.1 unnamed protein product [Lepeophtheirus salmonis]
MGALQRPVTCTKEKSQVPHDDPTYGSITPSKEPSSVPEEEELSKNIGNAPEDGKVMNNVSSRYFIISESDVNNRQIEITPRDVPLSFGMPNNSLTRQSHGVFSDKIRKRRNIVFPLHLTRIKGRSLHQSGQLNHIPEGGSAFLED